MLFKKLKWINEGSGCIVELIESQYINISIYVSDQKFKNLMDLLHVIGENKSHYMYIKKS